MKKMFRQGDVLIRQIDEIPANAQPAETNVVAVGEGHHDHVVYGDAQVLETPEKSLYISVNSEGVLEHNHTGSRNKADHDAITLPPGNYEVVLQRQYNPYEKAIERVRD